MNFVNLRKMKETNKYQVIIIKFSDRKSFEYDQLFLLDLLLSSY